MVILRLLFLPLACFAHTGPSRLQSMPQCPSQTTLPSLLFYRCLPINKRKGDLPLEEDLDMGRVDLDGLCVKVDSLLVVFVGEGMAALGEQVLNGSHCCVRC